MKKPVLILFSVLLFATIAVLFAIFAGGLNRNPRELPSVIEGQQLGTSSENGAQINIALPELFSGKTLTHEQLPEPPFLLNIWGTWCPACHQEHPYLLTLANDIAIIGINWPANNPDEPELAREFLQKSGNPYQKVLVDQTGQLIIDLGVYGAPETFLIGPDYRIVKRYAGPLNAEIWMHEFAPLLP